MVIQSDRHWPRQEEVCLEKRTFVKLVIDKGVELVYNTQKARFKITTIISATKPRVFYEIDVIDVSKQHVTTILHQKQENKRNGGGHELSVSIIINRLTN
jgi:hypothetical protein